MAKDERTLGEYRVGVNFNPSNNTSVDILKKEGARLLDMINNYPDQYQIDSKDSEILRLKNIAMDHIETGIMYAVKVVTKQPKQT